MGGEGSRLLEVERLSKTFPVERGLWRRRIGAVRAVDGVSFSIRDGETVGLVGESGSGKTTLARLILRVLAPTSGTVRFRGEDVGRLPRRALLRVRRELQMVFQDPSGSLDPRMTVAQAVAEPLLAHGIGDHDARRWRVQEELAAVGLQESLGTRYPHELSGGQRQRVGIARALVLRPRLLVLDEPVSSLDVSVQAQVLNLLQQLQERHRLTYLLIAHDLRVVRAMCDWILVMYLGRVVESGPSDAVYQAPRHPYTRALWESSRVGAAGGVVAGEVPSALAPPSGCAFHPRCPLAEARCRHEVPIEREVEPGRRVACHLA